MFLLAVWYMIAMVTVAMVTIAFQTYRGSGLSLIDCLKIITDFIYYVNIISVSI